MSKKIVYRLFALEFSKRNAERATKEKYHRITPGYILIYSRKGIKDALEISGSDLLELSDSDWLWLQDCNLSIMEQFVSENEESVLKSQERFVDEFLEELEKEETVSNGEIESEAGTE